MPPTTRHTSRRRSLFLAASLATSLLGLSGIVHTARDASAASDSSLTVEENTSYFGNWSGFDPITTGLSTFAPAVYGGLFLPGAHNQPIPDLATGYKLTDGGLKLTLQLRRGIKFTDGTPFNAAAVVFNMKRDLEPKNACTCALNWPMKSIAAKGGYTVVVNFSRALAPVMQSLPTSQLNLIASPTAMRTENPSQFNLKPVGAGPFEVVTDQPSSKLVLKANPNYWRKGFPKVNTLNVVTIGTDESAYEALEAGQAQIYEGLQTLPVLQQAKKQSKLKVYSVPANETEIVQFNTSAPPFNNIVAREALDYATNAPELNQHISQGTSEVSETPSGPAEAFFQKTVPGFRNYNLSMAKKLVKQLGGLHLTLSTINLSRPVQITEALGSEWSKAGIKATLDDGNSLISVVQKLKTGNWQAFVQEVGGSDPALGTGLAFRFGSTSADSGVHDKHLDSLMNQAAATFNTGARVKLYKEIYGYIDKQAYDVPLFSIPYYNVADTDVTGLTLPPGVGGIQSVIDWQQVGLKAAS